MKGSKVEFLHRTVRDFLLAREMSDYLTAKRGVDFMVNLSTLRALVAVIRSQIPEYEWISDEGSLMDTALEYANEALEESTVSTTALLEFLEDHYEQRTLEMGKSDFHYGYGIYLAEDVEDMLRKNPQNCQEDFAFRTKLITASVDKYVAIKLEESSRYFDNLSDSPLFVAVRIPKWTCGHTKIIAKLLESDHNPNEDGNNYAINFEWDSTVSPWCRFLQNTCDNQNEHNFSMAIEADLFTLFLKKGAKRDQRTATSTEGRNVSKLLSRLPGTCFIQVLFSYRCARKYFRQCLHMLEEFLRGRSNLVKMQFDEMILAMSHAFKNLSLQDIDIERLMFFVQVTKVMIRIGTDAGFDLDILIPDIQAMFTGFRGSLLVNMIQIKEKSDIHESSRRKRCAEVSEGISPRKLLRGDGPLDM